MPKIGTNTHSRYYKMLTPLSVERLQQFIKMVSDEQRQNTVWTIRSAAVVERTSLCRPIRGGVGLAA
jgi:hypothetical protein